MSINTALSGLSAAQHDIAATSHNIANVGTIGFRGSRAEFADVFNSSPYSISRTAVGSGVQTLRTAMQFSQGLGGGHGQHARSGHRGAGLLRHRARRRAQLRQAGADLHPRGRLRPSMPRAWRSMPRVRSCSPGR